MVAFFLDGVWADGRYLTCFSKVGNILRPMKMKYLALVATTSVMLGAGASAASISVNWFGGGNGANVTEPAGLTVSSVWNNFANSASPGTDLLDDSNVNTTADVEWTGGTWDNGGGPSGNAQLLDGYLDDNNAGGTSVTVTDIPYAQYDVHVYFNHDGQDGETGIFNVDSLNGVAYSTTGVFDLSNNSTGILDDGNSLTVSGLSGDLVIVNDERAANSISNISGIQIVEVIPEPSSTVLLGLGGVALLLRRRK